MTVHLALAGLVAAAAIGLGTAIAISAAINTIDRALMVNVDAR